MTFSPEAISKWESYILDWVYFAEDYLRVSLDDEQKHALREIQNNSKVAIASGTSRGKDYLMAVAALCFLYLTPRWDENGKLVGNTKVILTGPTGRQVQKIIMPEISRIFKGSIYLPGALTNSSITTPYEEWFLLAFKADDKNTEAWTGYHAANVFFGVTEATGMCQEVFDAIEGNLQGNSKLVLVFNPNINHGYAASAMKSPTFRKIRLNSLNAPNVLAKRIIHPGQVDYNWIKDRVTDWSMPINEKDVSPEEADFEFEGRWYRPNDLFRAKILGKFPKVSEGVLVPPEWIELANTRWLHNQKHIIYDPSGVTGTVKEVMMQIKALRMGNDVAGMGRDNSCECYRYGPYVDKFRISNSAGKAEHMEVAGRIVAILKDHAAKGRPGQSFIDTIGEGAGVFSRLVELENEGAAYSFLKGAFHSCKFSEAAELNGQRLKDVTGQYEFLNMRAYLFWAVRDWLNPSSKNEAALPPDDELLQELSETKWKFGSNGRIQIEPKEDLKKRIKRSPDKADALANTFYPVQDIDPRPKAKKNVAQYFH